jgi:hypothetical protein
LQKAYLAKKSLFFVNLSCWKENVSYFCTPCQLSVRINDQKVNEKIIVFFGLENDDCALI